MLHGFLGFTDFYRRFMRSYATLAAPFIDLLHNTKFTWNEAASHAFTDRN